MKALLLDDTHPFLEEALIQGGLELIKDYTRPLLDFPVSYFECTVLVIRSRMPINAKFLSQFPHLKVIGRMGGQALHFFIQIRCELLTISNRVQVSPKKRGYNCYFSCS